MMRYFNSTMQGAPVYGGTKDLRIILKQCLIEGFGEYKADAVNDDGLFFNKGYSVHQHAIYSITDKSGREIITSVEAIDGNTIRPLKSISSLEGDIYIKAAPFGAKCTESADSDIYSFKDAGGFSVSDTQIGIEFGVNKIQDAIIGKSGAWSIVIGSNTLGIKLRNQIKFIAVGGSKNIVFSSRNNNGEVAIMDAVTASSKFEAGTQGLALSNLYRPVEGQYLCKKNGNKEMVFFPACFMLSYAPLIGVLGCIGAASLLTFENDFFIEGNGQKIVMMTANDNHQGYFSFLLEG